MRGLQAAQEIASRAFAERALAFAAFAFAIAIAIARAGRWAAAACS